MADKIDYVGMIIAEIQELKANKKLRVEVAKIKRPISEIDKISVEAKDMTLPDDLMDFYNQCDGFQIVWREKIDKKQKKESPDLAAGEIGIAKFIETFVIHWKDKLWFDWMTTDEATPTERERFKLARALKGFDVMDKLLDKTLIIAFLLKSSELQSEKDIQVWYWNNKGIKFPMTLTPTDYLLKSLEYYGVLFWQLFYMDTKEGMREQEFRDLLYTVLEPMQNFISSFARIFPAKDIGYLREEHTRIEALVREVSARSSS